ncbi:hypothetical protein ALP98_01863 [Pseudomonas viridiflava]|nr:hypothetical protein ALQ09_03552 [Pseudomonas viridiflava]RMQ79847.1 hypothetical protein ALP98_01863 [Pseudomonas viridiflava]
MPRRSKPTHHVDGCLNPLPNQGIPMTDPRNVAHDKKVQQEKKNHGEEIAPNAEHAPQPGMKPALKHDDDDKQDEQA